MPPLTSHYQALMTIGDDIGRSVVSYLDKPDAQRAQDQLVATANTRPFDYYVNDDQEYGRAYALLVKKDGWMRRR